MHIDGSYFSTSYRLFETCGRGRIASAAQVVSAMDDETAVQTALALVGLRAAELWDGKRRVAMLNGSERVAG